MAFARTVGFIGCLCLCFGLSLVILPSIVTSILSEESMTKPLEPGDTAPDFAMEAAFQGKTFDFRIADALDVGPLVVYFYPKSFTKVCTEEARDFAEATDAFSAEGATVIGISGDPIAIQGEFSKRACAGRFAVGSDIDLTVARAYGAATAASAGAEQTSFVITPDHRIIETLSGQDAARHVTRALMALRSWNASRTDVSDDSRQGKAPSSESREKPDAQKREAKSSPRRP